MAGIKMPMSQSRKFESKEALFRARKRILKYLVLGYLKQEGYFNTADTFSAEAALTGEYEVCDNIDLDIMLQDYCSYYLVRFNKQPQFCRKVDERQQVRRPQTRGRVKTDPVVECVSEKEEVDLPSTFTITKLMKDEEKNLRNSPAIERKPLAAFLANTSPDKKQLVELLYQDIIRPSAVSWDDVKGLSSAKSLLMESVVYPVRYPEVFTGLLEPWRGVLLHGPPGTGKTMLAKAVASESLCTFFNMSCSTIVNKWRGESEKIIKVLFELASYYSPSIIFIDEVETLASERSAPGEHEASRRLKAQLLTELDGIEARDGIVFLLANSNMPWYPEVFTGLLEPWRGVLLHGPPGTGKTMLAKAVASESLCTFFNMSCSTIVNKWRGESEKIIKVLFELASYYSPSIIFIDEVETLASERSAPGEHEASRRLKAQLLTELDGIEARDGIVFLLANSNMPWEIDPAMLRRLEKRIFIPLPDFETRAQLFETYLNTKNIELYPKVDFKELATNTEGYSGSDIKLVCKEALMSTVRKILPNMAGKGNMQSRKDKLELSDILTAIEKTKPVSKNLATRHKQWQNEMGCS